MTTARLARYRTLQRTLGRCPDLPEGATEALRDLAEGLLLSGDDLREHAGAIEAEAALVLSRLVGEGLLTDARAETLFFGLSACGPEEDLVLSR